MKIAQENQPTEHLNVDTSVSAPEAYRISDFEHLRSPENPLAGIDGESIKFPEAPKTEADSVPLRKAAGAESMSDAVSGLTLQSESESPTSNPQASVGGIGGVGGGWHRPIDTSRVDRFESSHATGAPDFGALLRARDVRASDRVELSLVAQAIDTLRHLHEHEVLEMVQQQAAIEAAEARRRVTVPPGMIPAWLPPLPLPTEAMPRDGNLGIREVSAGTNSGSDQGRDEQRRRERESQAREQLRHTSEIAEPEFIIPARLAHGDHETDQAVTDHARKVASRVLKQLAADGATPESVSPSALSGLWDQLVVRA